MVDHGLGKVAHVGGGLDMEATKHGVGTTVSKQGNALGVNAHVQESGGAARAEDPGAEEPWVNASSIEDGRGGTVEERQGGAMGINLEEKAETMVGHEGAMMRPPHLWATCGLQVGAPAPPTFPLHNNSEQMPHQTISLLSSLNHHIPHSFLISCSASWHHLGATASVDCGDS